MQNFSEKIRIANDNTVGWYLKATNEIEAGEMILEEQPLLVVPHWDCERMKCANCMQDSFVMCKKCNFFPLCLDCITHDEFDCKFMASIIKKSDDTNIASSSSDTIPGNGISQDLLVKNYAIYAVIKLLLLMENERTRVQCEPLFPPIIDFNEDFRNSDMFLDHEETIVAPILRSGLQKFFQKTTKRRGVEIDADFLHELCFLIDANGFEVTGRYGSEPLKAIYTSGTKLPHNCLPNTVISFDDHFKMKIYASVPIPSGETIFNSYVNPLMGTAQRQLQLRLSRNIRCSCARCSDPTELNTHLSSLKCQQCTEGFMLPEKPLSNSNWKCNRCNALMTYGEVNNLLTEIADKMSSANRELETYDRLFNTYKPRFHPNHFIMLDIKQTIASLLTEMIINPYSQLDGKLMKRKLEISEEVLPIVRTLQPGISKLYTVALYDYLMLFMELTELNFAKKEIPLEEYVAALQRTNTMMNEVVSMLSFEPTNSTEGHLAQRIRTEKKQIEQQLESLIGQVN